MTPKQRERLNEAIYWLTWIVLFQLGYLGVYFLLRCTP